MYHSKFISTSWTLRLSQFLSEASIRRERGGGSELGNWIWMAHDNIVPKNSIRGYQWVLDHHACDAVTSCKQGNMHPVCQGPPVVLHIPEFVQSLD